tara:strand:- start:3784 stop:6267 length:2484 start_codon:yes stop_codon:yes gene_type:complete
MPVFTITEDEVTRLALPEYDNGLNEIQNGTFSNWVFNKSGYNSEIYKLINSGQGDELLENGIASGSALFSLKAVAANITDKPLIEIDEELDEEIVDDFKLELFYDLEESIDMEQFIDLLRKSGIILEENEVKRIFDGLDKNNTGTLEYNEVMQFVDYLRDKRTKIQQKKMLGKTTSEKNVVNIDTRYRSKYYNTCSTEFNYEIPEIQKNVMNMRIGSIELPSTNYTVSSKLGNNTMLIISDATSKTIEYDVSGSWRLQMQIGDISAEYHYGTIIENTSINVVDVSSAGAPMKVTPDNNNNNWIIEYSDFSYVLTNQQLTENAYVDISYYAHFHGKASGGPGDTYSQFRHGNGGPSYSSHLSYTPTITPITNVIFTTNGQPNEIASSTSTKTYEQQLALDNLSDVQTSNDLFPRNRNGIQQYQKISTNITLPHPETNVSMDYSLNHVPGSKQIDEEITTTNNIQTTTIKTIIKRYYNFIRLRRINWKQLLSNKPHVWNGLDGNCNSDTNKRRVLYSEHGNDYNVFKWLNVFFPRGNPRRTDISFNNLTYLDEYDDISYNQFDLSINYPFDCSMMQETTTETNVKKEVHLNALQYINAKDGSSLNGFNPVKCAWLVRIPDGNYDEAWNGNLSRLEKIVNDAINIATPGAIDVNGNFAAFKNPKHYDFINDNTFNKNILFKDNKQNFLKLNNKNNSFQFQIDRISKRSAFATSNIMNINNGNQNVITTKITKVNKFTSREGQSGIRTIFGGLNDWGTGHARYGEPYPEMVALLSKSREPEFVHTSVQRNPELIKMIRFNVKDDGNVDSETNIQHKLGWVLGFRSAEYLVQ